MKSKTPLSLSLFLVLFTTQNVCAEVLHWAQPCASGELVLKNNANSAKKAWLQKFSPMLTEEIEISLNGRESIRMPVNKKIDLDHFSVLHFESENTFHASVTCDQEKYAVNSLEGGVLTFAAPTKLFLQNLFTDLNVITIEEVNSKNELVMTTRLELENRKSQYFKPTVGTESVRLFATHRFSAFSITTSGSEGPTKVEPQKVTETLDGVFFEVGPRAGPGDTFIIQIKDPILIEKARDQITNPALEKIVFAQIQKGASLFNRNRSRNEKPFWSWFPSEVTNISDLGSTVCNGLPQFIEDRVDSWTKDPGRICFWSYRIKKELQASDIAQGL